MLSILLVIVIQRYVVLVFTTLPLYLTSILLYIFRIYSQFFIIYKSSNLLIIISKIKFPCALLSTRAINSQPARVTGTFRQQIYYFSIIFISLIFSQDPNLITQITSLVTNNILLYCLYRLISYYSFFISLYYTYSSLFSLATSFLLLIRFWASSNYLLVSSYKSCLIYFTRFLSLRSFRVYKQQAYYLVVLSRSSRYYIASYFSYFRSNFLLVTFEIYQNTSSSKFLIVSQRIFLSSFSLNIVQQLISKVVNYFLYSQFICLVNFLLFL